MAPESAPLTPSRPVHAEWRSGPRRWSAPLIALVFGATAAALIDFLFARPDRVVAKIPVITLMVLIMVRWPEWRRRAARRTLYADPDDLPVSLTLAAQSRTGESIPLGTDEGFLTLVDGWLVYRGVRTEWSVAPGDATRLPSGIAYAGPPVSNGNGRMEAIFSGDLGEIGALLRVWERGAVDGGTGRLPPIPPPPRRTLDTAALRDGIGNLVVVPLAWIAVIFTVPKEFFRLATAITVMWLVVSLVGTIRAARTRSRERRTLLTALGSPAPSGLAADRDGTTDRKGDRSPS